MHSQGQLIFLSTNDNQGREKVAENYKHGTYRYGFLDNISLVGTVSEESGGYIPDVLDMLEECPFLRLVRDPFFMFLPTLESGKWRILFILNSHPWIRKQSILICYFWSSSRPQVVSML